MRKVKFFSFCLLLTLGTATVMFNSCKDDNLNNPENIPVTGISLDIPTFTLTVGEDHTLKATVLPDNATDKTVTWTSSSDVIATVSNIGKVIAISKGTAIITA